MALTPDEERWAEALQVEKMHGIGAPRFVADRVGAMVLAKDAAGLARWKAIAARLEQLRCREPTA